jgi:D-proline reductase (dithiol) PrdB
VGLVQRAVEEIGIATVSISIMRKFTEETKAPRAVFVRWPLGHPLGEPFKPAQHRAVLLGALSALETIAESGTIIDLPYRWRRPEDWEGVE